MWYTLPTAGLGLREVSTFFKNKYGIDVEIVVFGKGSEMSSRLFQERRSGLFIADVLFAGLNTIFGTIKKSGVTDPLEPVLFLPEVLDPKVWFKGEFPWADEARHVITFYQYGSQMIGVNTDLVKLGEIGSYYDLIDPKWKGKILINDPTVEGTAFNGFSTLILNKVVDLEFFRKLVSMQTQLQRDERLQADWLAKGKYPVALWPKTGSVTEYQQAGAPVSFISVREGTYISSSGGNVVLINRAPHPNTARIFINWILTKEGQQIMQDSVQLHSAREDIPTNKVDPLKLRKPGEKYFQAANESEKWILEEQDRYFEIAKQFFGPLLGK